MDPSAVEHAVRSSAKLSSIHDQGLLLITNHGGRGLKIGELPEGSPSGGLGLVWLGRCKGGEPPGSSSRFAQNMQAHSLPELGAS